MSQEPAATERPPAGQAAPVSFALPAVERTPAPAPVESPIEILAGEKGLAHRDLLKLARFLRSART